MALKDRQSGLFRLVVSATVRDAGRSGAGSSLAPGGSLAPSGRGAGGQEGAPLTGWAVAGDPFSNGRNRPLFRYSDEPDRTEPDQSAQVTA
jgi:hypothetical protein